MTLRQRLTEHKRNPTCASCHLRIDPLGFPLEGSTRSAAARDLRRRDGRRRSRASWRTSARSSAPSGSARVPAVAGDPGHEDVLEEGDRLRAGAHRHGVRQPPGRRDDGARRRCHVRGRRDVRSQPAASSAITRGAAEAAPESDEPPAAGTSAPIRRRRREQVHDESIRTFGTRHGVTSCAAWASRWRCPGWNRCHSSRRRRGRRRPRAARRCVSASCTSRTVSSPSTGGRKAAGASMEIGPGLTPMMPHREDMVFIRGLFSESAQAVEQSPPRAHEHPVGGGGESRSEGDPGRHVDGSGAGAAHRQPDGRPEPGARHRAERDAARGRPVDDLRLEPCRGSRRPKPATKEIYPSRAFDRLVGDGSGRPLDRSILDEVRGIRAEPEAEASAGTTR
jgi:hypothetical protein